MLCHYGANGIFLDVTAIVYHLYVQDDFLILPAGPKNFNAVFGDPVCGVVKTLTLELDTRRTIIINENDSEVHQYELGVGDATHILELMANYPSVTTSV